MTSPHPKSPAIHIPPPLVYAAALGLGLYLSHYNPVVWLPVRVSRLTGWFLIAASLAVAAPAIILFQRAGTTIRPDRAATKLMTRGPYRFTRNPMYVSLALLYTGIAVLWQSLWALVLLPAVLFYIDRFVIRREEVFLKAKFGPAYAAYCARVRRWIGFRSAPPLSRTGSSTGP